MATLHLKWIAGAGSFVRPAARFLALLRTLVRVLLDSPFGVLLPLLAVVPLLLLLLT